MARSSCRIQDKLLLTPSSHVEAGLHNAERAGEKGTSSHSQPPSRACLCGLAAQSIARAASRIHDAPPWYELQKALALLWASFRQQNRQRPTWPPLTSTACQEPMRQGVPITFFAFSWPVIFARDLMITLSAYLSSILQECRAGDQPCDQGGTPMPAGILAGRKSLVKPPRLLQCKHKQQQERKYSALAQPACPACMASAPPAGLAARWGERLLQPSVQLPSLAGQHTLLQRCCPSLAAPQIWPMQASTQHQHTTVSFTLMRTCHS